MYYIKNKIVLWETNIQISTYFDLRLKFESQGFKIRTFKSLRHVKMFT